MLSTDQRPGSGVLAALLLVVVGCIAATTQRGTPTPAPRHLPEDRKVSPAWFPRRDEDEWLMHELSPFGKGGKKNKRHKPSIAGRLRQRHPQHRQ